MTGPEPEPLQRVGVEPMQRVGIVIPGGETAWGCCQCGVVAAGEQARDEHEAWHAWLRERS